MIAQVKEIELQFKNVETLRIKSRVIRLPIAFEDSETRKAVEKYRENIRSGAPNCEGGYNLDYIAAVNGTTKQEVKDKVLTTEWLNSGCGFWPGGGFFRPVDPRCALVVPKYNPPRTWTPEGAVGIGGPCIFTYTTPVGGGYQLFSRTIPTFQFAMKRPQFKGNPCLYRNVNRIKFFEVSEDEILDIYKHVHEEIDYRYQVEDGEIVVKDYLAWLNREDIKGYRLGALSFAGIWGLFTPRAC
ncbi:MAG: carboxyltransferase domain-containing protein [Oscillospiraceae bacterium]|nr:carboxyltransferase domain-containing protein [Oscillospiraceae bacterium]